jgi:dTDP-4-dehydrorhamnose 3,5-epimerase
VTNLYDQNAELGVSWNDPELNIDWGLQSDKIILSEKDKMQSSLKDFISPF